MKAFLMFVIAYSKISILFAQSITPDGKFSQFQSSCQYAGNQTYRYKLYEFSRAGNTVKAKYFAQNTNNNLTATAYSQYNTWKANKRILLVTSGALSNTFESNAVPIGLCVNNGTIINRTADLVMDGMVIVYNGGEQQGGIAVADMDLGGINADRLYSPRTNPNDCVKFLEWGQRNELTLFQTQLLYSKGRQNPFPSNESFGERRERRFLAICKKGTVYYHVIVDAPDALELTRSAKCAKAVLEADNLSVMFILNLDTGCKNHLLVYDGRNLVDKRPWDITGGCESRIENASNLIVYYTD